MRKVLALALVSAFAVACNDATEVPTELPDSPVEMSAFDQPDGRLDITGKTGFDDQGLSLFNMVNGAGPAPVCPAGPIAGTLDPATSATQLGRMFRDGVASTCAGKSYPGLYSAGTTYYYELFGPFMNAGEGTCATVYFDTGTCTFNAHANAYVGGYDPANQGVNYLGDVGSSVTQPFGFTIPDGQTYYIVVNNTFGPITCDFSFEIADVPCSAGAFPPVGYDKSGTDSGFACFVPGVGTFTDTHATVAASGNQQLTCRGTTTVAPETGGAYQEEGFDCLMRFDDGSGGDVYATSSKLVITPLPNSPTGDSQVILSCNYKK